MVELAGTRNHRDLVADASELLDHLVPFHFLLLKGTPGRIQSLRKLHATLLLGKGLFPLRLLLLPKVYFLR